jgi:O-antigen/teichoic acid export membrane protein
VIRLSPSRRGVLALVGGTGAGQAIAFAAAPFIGRLYPPHVFGPFAVINSVVFSIAPVAALRYDLAIPVPQTHRDARALASVGLRLAALLVALGTVVAWFARHGIAHLLGLSDANTNLVLWIPLVAGLMGMFMVLNQLAIRARMYSAIARRNVLQAAATVVFQILAGLAGLGANGLAAGLALGQLTGVIALALSLRGALRDSAEPGPDEATSRRELMSRYRTFPLLLAPSGLINSLGLQAPVLLASTLFGATIAGWLGMTQRVLAVPVALFGLTLAQVFLGEFGAAKRERSAALRSLFLRTSGRLAVVGALGGVILVALAPVLFAAFLGEQWRRSGVYAQALAIGLMFQMVASPLSQTIIVMRKNHYQAAWDVSRLVVCSGAVWAGYKLAIGDVRTMWLLGAATAIMYALLWGLSWMAIVKGERVSDHARAVVPGTP